MTLPADNEATRAASTHRLKGRPARIDRKKIVDASRQIPAERLTMQAVAEVLGVDPTALNYHVGGKDGFMRLIAEDRARAAVDDFELPDPSTPWQETLVVFAHAMRRAVTSIGPLSHYIESIPSLTAHFLSPVEHVLRVLVNAGFDIETAVRSIALVSHVAALNGRLDAKRKDRRNGVLTSHTEERIRFFESEEADSLPLLREVVLGDHPDLVPDRAGGTEEQFDFDLDVLIAGMERLLEGSVRAD